MQCLAQRKYLVLVEVGECGGVLSSSWVLVWVWAHRKRDLEALVERKWQDLFAVS
jgi:hypothetical protein